MMTLLDFPGVKREGVLLEGSDVADTGPLVLPPSAGAGDRTQEPQLTLTVVLHGFHSEQKNALLQTFMEYGIRVQILEETPEHPVDLEVRAIERFGDLVRMEVAGAEVDVVGWIGPWRRRVLEAAMGTLLERLREKRGEHFNVLLGLHTYPWTGELPDLRLDVSREADVSEHMNTTRLKLDSVYLALAAARPGLVRVKVLAPQWVSVLAGFTFRAVTNMPVAFLQGTGGGSDAEWRFDSADSAFAPPAAVIEGADAADADVLHLVVLCTSGGSIEAYWRWMGDDGRRIRRVMIVQEVVVPDGAAAARWADDLRRLIAENRPGATDISRLPPRIIRLFLAVPGGLAFALGRKLNALGKVSLTDFDREGQVYVAEVELVT